MTNPIDDPQSYDVVRIDGVENPGIIAPGGISGFKRPTEWDIKKGKGTKGGTATLSQLPPAKGSIKFLLWSAFHFEAWDQIYRKRFKYDSTKKSVSAVDIYHPALATVDIHSVVTESISPPEHEGKGLWSITVEFIEYLPPPKKTATSTPTGSTSNTTGGNKSGKSDDPIADAQQAEIAALMKQANPSPTTYNDAFR